MRRKRQEKLERSRESASYTPDDVLENRTDIANRAKYYGKLYPHMFIEDVKLGIMPIGGRTSKKKFNILLDPPDPRAQQIIENAISPDRYHHDLAGIICDFIANCAVYLLIYETVTYEIVYLSEPKKGEKVGFELVQINPFTLVQRGDSLSQFLPDEKAKHLSKRRCIKLNPERILTFKLPTRFQGRMDQMMESLAILSVPTAPEFFMKDLDTGTRTVPYDVKTHLLMHNIALARATKSLGWNARLLFQQEALEYYLIYRNLLFEEFKIELRDEIMDTLNAGIECAGRQLGFNAKIIVSGLPSASEVQAAYKHLQEGDIPFGEILGTFQGF